MGYPVTIIGAGFSGLVAAWSLNRKGYSVKVIERGASCGGLIHTLDINGCKVETAANGLLSSHLVEELFSDCGVPLVPVQAIAKKRYLAVDGRVTRWPLGFGPSLRAFFGLMSLVIFRIAPHLKFLKSPAPVNGETLLDWGRRVFGNSFSEKVLSTGVMGIFAASASSLSARLITRRFFQTASVGKGKSRKSGTHVGTVSAKAGMGDLISGLKRTLESRGVEFQFSTDGSQYLAGALLSPEGAPGQTVIVATSASQAAVIFEEVVKQIVANQIPGKKDESVVAKRLSEGIDSLRQIAMIDLVSVTLHFKKPAKRVGFGTLFSQDEKFGGINDGLLGVLQNSVIFPGRAPSGTSSETWILGGQTWGPQFLQMDDQHILNSVLKKRLAVLGEDESQILSHSITKWPRAIPHYSIELERVQDQLNQPFESVLLFGNYLGEIGLRSILEQAERLPERMAKG